MNHGTKEFGSGMAREIKVGYAKITFEKTHIPVNATVIGYTSETKRGITSEYVIFYEEAEG
ncbi:unnamed protein product [marine sediment metagenome]|uniref:Uncharacterized protein n=1 Tax=marine sediment metagenome TaxID=412755 RepID=X1TDS9_9ZZZZ